MPITERGPDPTLRSAGQDPDDAARMARVLGGVVVAATAFGAVHGVAALLLADPAVGAFAALHLVVAGVAVVGRSLLLRGQVERSAFVMIPGILATAVAWLVLMPGLTEIAALAPILVVAYALPFATRRVLVRVVVTALGGGAILALTNRAATGLAGPPVRSAYVDALQEPTLAVATVLVVLAMWRFSVRLHSAADRANAADELVRTRERAIAATSCGVLIVDVSRPNWPIEFVNPAFERITGYTAEEAVGSDGLMLVGPETDREVLARHLATMASGETGTVTILNYRKDGSTFWNELTVSPMPDDASDHRRYVVVQTDVTAERNLEEQLRHAQRMETVGQLAGGIAHDFNNILTAIGGNARVARSELAGANGGDAAAVEEALDEIVRASDRAAALTRQLLAFGRRQVFQPQVVVVESIVADVLPMLRRLVGDQYRIETDLAPAPSPVLADPGQLEQVLLNLVLNARDASPSGGTICIGTSHATLDGAPLVRLTVSDDGSGMPPDVQEHIFEPFFTTKPVGKGTGLGLSTVYGIVTQSGGRIRCRSIVGVGTTFEVDLPVHERRRSPVNAHPGISAGKAPVRAAPTPGMTPAARG